MRICDKNLSTGEQHISGLEGTVVFYSMQFLKLNWKLKPEHYIPVLTFLVFWKCSDFSLLMLWACNQKRSCRLPLRSRWETSIYLFIYIFFDEWSSVKSQLRSWKTKTFFPHLFCFVLGAIFLVLHVLAQVLHSLLVNTKKKL